MASTSRNKMPKEKARLKSRKKLESYKTKMRTHDKRFPLEMPDVSRILKVPGTDQGDESDELFDPPLHSTAVFAEEEVEKELYSEHEESNSEPAAPVTPRQVVKKDHAQNSQGQLAIKSRQKKRKDSESKVVKETMIPRMTTESPVQQEEECSPGLRAEIADPGDDTTYSVKIWCPSGFPSHVTELDVVLDEFEKVTAQYKQGVEMKICRRAIDSFYIGVRDQLIDTSTGAEELRRTKLRSAKMVGKINKKRLRLIEVKEELIRTESQLKKLQRECADLKEKISSLRNARQLLTILKDLQHEYVHNQKKNPQVIYGVHSLPALLMESRRILGAESHFQNINSKLQQMLDLQNE